MIPGGFLRIRAFSLVELLVTVSVIAVLVAMTLPSLARSRDAARRVVCYSNQKQIYVFSAAFQADRKGAYLPAWYYAYRPEGPAIGEDVTTSLYGSNWNHFTHMLIDLGYASEGYRVDIAGLTGTQVYAKLRQQGRSSPFMCPEGTLPTAEVWRVNDAPDTKTLRTLMPAFDSYLKTSKTQAYRALITAYAINADAGSNQYYHNYLTPNQGFYPVKRWVSNPSEIGYILENNREFSGSHHLTCHYDPNCTSYAPGGKTHLPTTRHDSLKKGNMVFLDGHSGELKDTIPAGQWPFQWY